MSEYYEARMDAMAERLRHLADEKDVEVDDIDSADIAVDYNDLD